MILEELNKLPPRISLLEKELAEFIEGIKNEVVQLLLWYSYKSLREILRFG